MSHPCLAWRATHIANSRNNSIIERVILWVGNIIWLKNNITPNILDTYIPRTDNQVARFGYGRSSTGVDKVGKHRTYLRDMTVKADSHS